MPMSWNAGIGDALPAGSGGLPDPFANARNLSKSPAFLDILMIQVA
jgi:hypothetical protein